MRRELIRAVVRRGILCALLTAVLPRTAAGQQAATPRTCEDLQGIAGLVWQGEQRTMRLRELVALAAPVFWLSPDEPTMGRRRGPTVHMPAALPFEAQPDSPVVYYQLDEVLGASDADGPAYQPNPTDKGDSVIDLRNATSLRLKYITYFPTEAGIGEHPHDVEPTEFRILVARSNGPVARQYGFSCTNEFYVVIVVRVTGEAHGNRWYYNVLDVDRWTTLPIHVLVEEGKHAAATDKNADGYFTPGYDVSVRPNDAWGVRDTIRGGTLFTGKFEAWMAKVRQPEHRILPPLPATSPLRARLADITEGDGNLAVYELRPMPSSTLATADALLAQKMAQKEVENWPVVEERAAAGGRLVDWFREGRQLRPFSFAYMYDGDAGFSMALPLLILKTVHEPLTGGYLVHRFTFKDTNLRDVSWMLMYTPSASRWFDQYVAGGMEANRFRDEEGVKQIEREFALEMGVKFRFRAPRGLGWVTNFWGVRAGIKNIGAVDIQNMKYVIEVGAGVW